MTMLNNYFDNFNFYAAKKFGFIFKDPTLINCLENNLKKNDFQLFVLKLDDTNIDISLFTQSNIAFLLDLKDISNFNENQYTSLFHIIYKLHFNNCLYYTLIDDFTKLNSLNEISNLSITEHLKKILELFHLENSFHLITDYNIILQENTSHLLPLPVITFVNFLDVNSINYKFNFSNNYILEITFNNQTYYIDYVRYKNLSNPRIIQLTSNNLKTIQNSVVDFNSFLENLNIEIENFNLDDLQNQAANSLNGTIRVLAPAGAGKTKTLISRIINLLKDGIKPSEIAVLAFNKKAANEIIERLNSYNIQSSNSLWSQNICVKTFHSFGYEVIRDILNWPLDLENAHQNQRNLIKSTLRAVYDIPANKIDTYVESFVYEVNKIKSQIKQLSPQNTIQINGHTFDIHKFYTKYEELVEAHKFYNFDDMIFLALKLLYQHKDYREKLKNKLTYYLVDEFQDLNDSQFNLIYLLAKPNDNIFVVGDDDQMIYSWRGAQLEYILHFEKYYPLNKTIILKYNYRCAKEIVISANRLIKYNTNRIDKDITPADFADDGLIDVHFSHSIWKQAIDVTNIIQKIKDENNLTWSDFALLFRYHAYAFPIAIYMDKNNIPHTNVNYNALLKSAPVSDILSYLTLIIYPEFATYKDFERILFRPLKYIKHSTIFSIKDIDAFYNYKSDYENDNKNLNEFRNKIKELQKSINKKTSKEILELLNETFELKKFYSEQFKVLEVDEAPDTIIFDVLLDISEDFADIKDFYEFLNKPTINLENQSSTTQDGITFTTIHSTKGNEYKNVILFNFVKEKFKSQDNKEEERRLAYVAITRGKHRTIISTNENNYSIFLEEIFKNPDYKGLNTLQLEKKLLELKTKKLFSPSEQIEKTIKNIEKEISFRKQLKI